jgi:hypothetical protein
MWLRGHLLWHDLYTKLYLNLPTGSKVIRGRGDRQAGYFLFLESRLRKARQIVLVLKL